MIVTDKDAFETIVKYLECYGQPNNITFNLRYTEKRTWEATFLVDAGGCTVENNILAKALLKVHQKAEEQIDGHMLRHTYV
jgi:hypothetical protein